MGGSKSSGSNRTFSSSESFIDPTQAPVIEFLMNRGTRLARGGGGDVTNPAMGAWLEMLSGGQSGDIMGQIDQGTELINRNLTENILPSIGAGAAAAGQRGSSRHGVAEGIASRAAIESSADFAENMLFQDINARQDRSMSALAMAPMMSGLQFAPLTNLANLLGRGTVLSESSGVGRGSSNSKGIRF